MMSENKILQFPSRNQMISRYDNEDIPPVDLPQDVFPENVTVKAFPEEMPIPTVPPEFPMDVIPDEVPRRDGPGGEDGQL